MWTILVGAVSFRGVHPLLDGYYEHVGVQRGLAKSPDRAELGVHRRIPIH
jgi:hypothetical protein